MSLIQTTYLVKYTYRKLNRHWVNGYLTEDELDFELEETQSIVVAETTGYKWSRLLRKIKQIPHIHEIKSIEKIGRLY